ncbi:MAG: SPFH domain-containing protein [Candidatus Wukongarchaeota archaeon]|nr:SPFH domain-containing protein [Candidatus Wukongarchaeota archaeon]
MVEESLIIIGFVGLVIFFYGLLGIKIVKPNERGVVERLGNFNRIIGPGLQFIIPLFEKLRKVDLREQVADVPPQGVITKDNVVVTVDAVIYYEITDPKSILYNIANFSYAVTKLAQTNLRNIIGEMELDESLTSRERINAELRKTLDDATDKWGVRVTRVEIQRIDPPNDVVDAMHKQMKSERERRAVILEAEGFKRSAILKAEGEKQSKILKAEGESESIRRIAEADREQQILLAEGEAKAIKDVFQAIHEGNPTNDLLAIKYLEALAKIADGKSNKVFLPLEATKVLGSLGAIGEMFKEIKTETRSSSSSEKEEE